MYYKFIKSIAIALTLYYFMGGFLVAQNVGINTSGDAPDASAMLDISSSSKGLLVPRVALTSLTDASTVSTPATSLLVYNTNAALSGGVGYFYNSGTSGSPVWLKIGTTGVANGSVWTLSGNSGTTSGTHFLGTTDAQGLVLKTNNSSRLSIASDGITTIGGASNRVKISADGNLTLEGEATVFKDLMIYPDAAGKGASSPPVLTTFTNGVYLWMFSSGTDKELFFTVQIPHDYKEGSTLYPHVHWTTVDATPGRANVIWKMEYTVATLGSAFGTTATLAGDSIIAEISSITGNKQHLISDLGTISGSGLTISTVLICRLYRATTDPADTFAGDVGLLSIDFHYEADALGSNTLYTK